MATTVTASSPVSPAVSIEEYLRTAYRPDVEYLDGELKEKPVVMSVHGRLQVLLGSWFDQHEEGWQVLVGRWSSTRVGLTRVRMPDVVSITRDSGRRPLLNLRCWSSKSPPRPIALPK